LKRPHEGILDQIVDLVVRADAEGKPRQRLRVTRHELRGSTLVTLPPSRDEIQIRRAIATS
jgi:hypothetical protein